MDYSHFPNPQCYDRSILTVHLRWDKHGKFRLLKFLLEYTIETNPYYPTMRLIFYHGGASPTKFLAWYLKFITTKWLTQL